MHLFRDAKEAQFTSRPNRFVVLAQEKGGRQLKLHCPNPGKLGELMIPGRKILWSPKDTPKTDGLLEAILYKGVWVPLVSAKANDIAQGLLIPKIFPNARVNAEVSVENSRLDFLVRTDGKESFLEIKACTLVEEGRAMFPDAPSERALRHLEELARLRAQGQEARAWVLALHSQPRWFTPSLHTDPAFSKRLQTLVQSGELQLEVFSLELDPGGTIKGRGLVEIDFQPLELLESPPWIIQVRENLGKEDLTFYRYEKWNPQKPKIPPPSVLAGKDQFIKASFALFSYRDPTQWWENWFSERSDRHPTKELLKDPEFWEALLLWRHRLAINPGELVPKAPGNLVR